MSARDRPEVVPADLEHLDHLDTDGLVLGLFDDERPLEGVVGLVDWRLCGELSRRVSDGEWVGQAGEQVLMPGRGRLGAQRLFLFGLGARKQYASVAAELGQRLVTVLVDAGCRRVAVGLRAPSTIAVQALRPLIQASAVEGITLLDEDGRLDTALELAPAPGKKRRE